MRKYKIILYTIGILSIGLINYAKADTWIAPVTFVSGNNFSYVASTTYASQGITAVQVTWQGSSNPPDASYYGFNSSSSAQLFIEGMVGDYHYTYPSSTNGFVQGGANGYSSSNTETYSATTTLQISQSFPYPVTNISYIQITDATCYNGAVIVSCPQNPITQPQINIIYPQDQTQWQPITNFTFQIINPTSSAITITYQQIATSTATSTYQFTGGHNIFTTYYQDPNNTSTISLPQNINIGGSLGQGLWMAQATLNYGSQGNLVYSPIIEFGINYNAPTQGENFLGIPLDVTSSSLVVGQNFAFYGVTNTSTQNCSLPSSSFVDCGVQYLVNNTIGTLFIPQGNITAQLASTTTQFQNVFPFNLYFGIIGGVQNALTIDNVATTTELSLSFIGLHGEQENVITITSSTLLNALTTTSETTIFGTIPGSGTAGAQTAINNINLVMDMGIWMVAGIKIIGIIIKG